MKVLSVRKKLGLTNAQYSQHINKLFSVNGEEPCTMTEYLYTNLIEKDVDHISIDDALSVMMLGVGDTYNIYPGDVKRLK